jgi:hypothetical protein
MPRTVASQFLMLELSSPCQHLAIAAELKHFDIKIWQTLATKVTIHGNSDSVFKVICIAMSQGKLKAVVYPP